MLGLVTARDGDRRVVVKVLDCLEVGHGVGTDGMDEMHDTLIH